MNIKDWEILSMIIKEGNITKAARKLFFTQPAITLRVQKIEKELGVQNSI
ncbi:MAG: LysR family transcriptional regulator [Bacillota bacterium]